MMHPHPITCHKHDGYNTIVFLFYLYSLKLKHSLVIEVPPITLNHMLMFYIPRGLKYVLEGYVLQMIDP